MSKRKQYEGFEVDRPEEETEPQPEPETQEQPESQDVPAEPQQPPETPEEMARRASPNPWTSQ